MKKRFMLSVVVMTILFMPVMGSATDYSYLISFGDSLSDQGNLYAQSPTSVPNTIYYQGRFTNGRVWVEYLKDELNIADANQINLAYGGAVSKSEGGAVSEATKSIPDLSTQITIFLSAYLGREETLATMFQTGLVTIWIGGNDITNSLRVVSGSEGWTVIVDYQTVADNVQEALETLVTNHAKNFLVLLLPNVGATPTIRGEADAAPDPNKLKASAIATEWVSKYNEALKVAVDKVIANHSDASLTFYVCDVNTLLTDAMTNPSTYGMDKVDVTSANFKTAAFTTAYYQYLQYQSNALTEAAITSTIDSLTGMSLEAFETQLSAMDTDTLNQQLANLQTGAYFDNSDPVYLFWDGFHPTTQAHQLIAQTAAELIQNDTTYQAQAVESESVQVYEDKSDSCFISVSMGNLLN